MTGTRQQQAAAGQAAVGHGTGGHGTAGPATRALVVGLGSPDRGDDGVGPVVARHVASLPLSVDVLVHEDPTDLVELWCGRSVAVVVDAVRSGALAGTVHVLETCGAGDRGFHSMGATTSRGGTHAFGLATAVELARVLHRLPPRLVVVGVEGVGFDHGASLSPEVEAAVPAAVAAVVTALARTVREGDVDVPG